MGTFPKPDGEVGAWAALAVTALAIAAGLRKPFVATATAWHRYFGRLAFADEMAAVRTNSAALPRLEGKVDGLAEALEEIRADVRMLLRELIRQPEPAPAAVIVVPEYPLGHFPRAATATPDTKPESD